MSEEKMSQNLQSTPYDWFGQLRLQYSDHSVYDYLVVEEKLFTDRWHLWSFALVYGILHNKKEKNKRTTFVPLTQISDNHVRDMIAMCYLLLDDGRTTKEIFSEMNEYADGGVTELNKIFKENKTFTIPNLVKDANGLWNKRIKDLQNINLAKS